MKTEEEKFKDLAVYIAHAPLTRLDREIINMIGLYGEYVVNSILENKSEKGLHKINSQDTKLKILYELKEISSEEYDVLEKLRTIRNRYTHDLELSDEDMVSVGEAMKNITINWRGEEDSKIEQDKIMKKYPFFRFQVSCLCKIKHLMGKIAEIKGQKYENVKIVVRVDNSEMWI